MGGRVEDWANADVLANVPNSRAKDANELIAKDEYVMTASLNPWWMHDASPAASL